VARDTTVTEALLRRERLLVLAGLLLITALAWWWVVIGSGTGMSAYSMTTWRFPPPLHMARVDIWSPSYALVMFFMWWIMMIAMMIPSATPTILLYGHAYRHQQRHGKLPAGAVPTFVFVLGYLLSWAAFSGAATGLQWGLERVALIHQMMMWSINPIFTAALLIAAGLYQLTPLKTVCLEHCRSPAQYLAQHFRPGAAGAFRLGWRHGAYCLGCCWFLMALLFAGGIMNLVWIAGLAVYVLIEKVAPNGQLIARMAGVAMVLVGLWVAAGPMLPE
jgi:predicted metal-binding membrane protein